MTEAQAPTKERPEYSQRSWGTFSNPAYSRVAPLISGIPPTQLGDPFNTSLLAALGHQRISKAIRALVSVPTNARALDRLHMNHPQLRWGY